MKQEILSESEELFKELETIDKFKSRYDILPPEATEKLAGKLRELGEKIKNFNNPKNQKQLIESELKRRLLGGAFHLESILSSEYPNFKTLSTIFGVPMSDINNLKNWLMENKERTLKAIDRLYTSRDIKSYELVLHGDIPGVRRQAEEFGKVYIDRYHRAVGRMLQDLTNIGEFLRDIKAVPTENFRSYFNRITNTLAIGLPAICFTDEDGALRINERELIALYGHEGMGHALHQMVTKTNNLPYFLRYDSALISATKESIAQFYENVLFEDIKNSSEMQKELDIEHKFDEIHQEHNDKCAIENYKRNLFYYGVTVLANKSLGKATSSKAIEKRKEILKDVTLDPSWPTRFVEDGVKQVDSKGNLQIGLVGELRYCARPIERAIAEFDKKGIKYEGEGRSFTDLTLLKGFWTPTGFVQNARLRAAEYAAKN
jgi:hypothetical protein